MKHVSNSQLGLILVVGLAVGLIVGVGGSITFLLLDTEKTEHAPVPEEMANSQHQMPITTTDESGEREVLYWFDPMHPSYRSDQPGTAPDCGMALVPRYADEMEVMAEMAPGAVMLSTEKQQLIGVRTATVQRDRLRRTIRTVGRVAIDETRLSRVHTKVEGWVEEVYGDFTGKLVRKGQPLFTLYSPELVSTQEEYLIARRGQADLGQSTYANVSEGSDALLRAARQRLRLWDITEEQIQKLEETGKVQRTLTIHSPVTGFIHKLDIFPQTFVKPDKVLYEIANLSRVWVHADLYEFEAAYVRTGQQATMSLSYAPGKEYRGQVTYLYPTVDPQTRTTKVRLEFRNPGFQLKPDMYTDVELQVDYGKHVVIPSEAILDSGLRKIVYVVQGGGVFEPREVESGPAFDGQTAILRGLEPGETIVTSGNFLLDSESKLKTAASAVPIKH
jgi:RND family efflux transporter MFP subunit